MAAILVFASSFGFMLLLLGGIEREQILAGGVLALIAVIVSVAIRRVADRPVSFSPKHLAPWLRAIARVPLDTARVGTVLLSAALGGGSPGRARRVAFRSGTRDDPAERGRRATALLAGSLTPEAIIVNAAPNEDMALVHVMSGNGPNNAEWLA